jgi:hypothetical protein
LILCLGLVGCGGTTPSASPTGQAAIATASPALPLTPPAIATPLAPTSTPVPTQKPALEIPVGSIATVVTDGLRVRSRPEVSDASTKLVPLLHRGQQVFVVKGPVTGSGYRWYEVQPLGTRVVDNPSPFGWVAVGDKNGEPWIKGGGFACPKSPTTYRAVVALEPLAWVACFGRKSITFPALLADPEATCGVDAGWTITPEWLGGLCTAPEFLVWDPEGDDSYFESVIVPSLDTGAFRPGPERKDWIRVKVTGHFDHKAAPKCKGISFESYASVPVRDEIITRCRATFVLTGIARRS